MESFRLTLAFIFIIVTLASISAVCDSSQIDINSASLEKLDGLQGIGVVKAQAIIDSRPFDSVDDLIDVYGIGEITLDNIKSQGLACVADEAGIAEKNDIKNSSDMGEPFSAPIVKIEASSTREKELEAINLNPKAIKSDIDSEVSGKRDYAFYGLIVFGILLGLLFLIKKKRYKNEFG